jgi:hypothetical protein
VAARTYGLICIAAAGLWASASLGQTAPATQPAPRPTETRAAATKPAPLDLNILRHIPADSVAVFVVPGVRRTTDRVNGFVKSILPPQRIPGFDVLKFLRMGLPLGSDFHADGAFAALLLDPSRYAPNLVARARKAGGEEGEVFWRHELPWAVIVPAQRTDQLLREVEFVREGNYLKVIETGDSEPFAWAWKADGYVVITRQKVALEAFPVRRSILTRLTPAQEQMLTRDHAWLWVDRLKCRELHEARLMPDARKATEMLGMLRHMVSPANPFSVPLVWAHMTRGEIFFEATTLSGGIRFADEGIRLEARWSYPADSVVAKALAAYRPPAGRLISRLPDLPAVFAYGATKSFKTPAEIKERQYKKLLSRGPFQDVPAELRARALRAILAVQEQVTGVQHYAGATEAENGAMAFASVIECKSAAELIKTVKQIQQIAVELRPHVKGLPLAESTFRYVEASVVVGRIKADAIEIEGGLVTPASEEGKQRMKGAIDDDKFRLLIAPVDQKTVVVTLGGGEAFVAAVVKAATGPGSATASLHDSVRRALNMLPADRAVEVRISIKGAVDLARSVFSRMGEQDFLRLQYESHAPIVGAVAIDQRDLIIVGFIPSEMPREYYRMMMRAMGGAD